jgi:hypothetical protein
LVTLVHGKGLDLVFEVDGLVLNSSCKVKLLNLN